MITIPRCHAAHYIVLLLFLTGCRSTTPSRPKPQEPPLTVWSCEAIYRNHDEYFFTPQLPTRVLPPKHPALLFDAK
ncbi:MAG: hypothetical protein JSS62_00045 [Verrucomicrobia bacterium]|nr:hypothetical protein [Verrucomicrobiota bacterium]MBS0646526.1 hypothetical protein [Verrucomicrobiota bacterium]